MNAKETRIPSLDGLRAVSILIVVFSHISYSQLKVDNFYLTGNLGVRVFFAISGFLITDILLRELANEGGIRLARFYFRRAMRILPAFLFFVGIIYAYLFFVNEPPASMIYPLTYTTDYFFMRVPVEVRHTWSLSVEEKFYLVFPVVLALFGRRVFGWFLAAVVIATPVMRYYAEDSQSPQKLLEIGWQFHLNMDVLATGCLLALFRERLRNFRAYRFFLRTFPMAGLLALLVFVAGYESHRNMKLFYLFGITAMNFAIVAGVDWVVENPGSLVGKVLNFRPLAYIGILSYSIYLWQEPFTFYQESAIWTHLPYNFIGLTVFALASYYLVEKKFLDLRRQLEPRLFEPGPRPGAMDPNYGSNS